MKTTKTRKALIELLQKENKALSAKQIHNNLKEFDLATIYRNLNLFVKKGLIRELRLSKGKSLYEVNNDGHEHTICKKCGKISHIKVNKSNLKKLLKLKNFEIEDIEINIIGHCN